MLQPNVTELDESGLDEDDDGESGGEGKSAEELTMADCFNFNAMDPETAEHYTAFADFATANMKQPWSQVRAMIPSELLIYVYAEPECQ
jgi:hypothetical protein